LNNEEIKVEESHEEHSQPKYTINGKKYPLFEKKPMLTKD